MPIIYTPAQIDAISHRDGNLLILACAGSGKTEVVSRRIAELVREGIPRAEIVAFTFMEKAAEELKARIRGHLETLLPEDPSLGDMYVGTIHSFSLQLLKELDPQYRGFEVMDEARQAALLVSQYYGDDEHGIGLVRLENRAHGYSDTIKRFKATLGILHTEGISPEKLGDAVLEDAIERYTRITRGRPNQFFDFNSIIDELIKRLKADENALESVRTRFRYLVVDEYQDIDPRQETLIALVTDQGNRTSVTVVGDDDQAIFGWRGAQIDNILTFEERYPDVTSIRLVDNFRSTHAVVELANAAISRLPPGRRLDKQMIARRWDRTGQTPALVEQMAEHGDIQRMRFESDQDEAEWVASRIKQLLGVVIEDRDGTHRPLHYSDMAILLRRKASFQTFVNTLEQRGIPVRVTGAGGLFRTTEIRVINAVFALLSDRPYVLTDLDDGQRRRLDEAQTRAFVRNGLGQLRQSGDMPAVDPVVFLGWVAAKCAILEQQKLPREQRGGLSRRIYPQAIFHEMLSAMGAGDIEGAFSEEVLYNLGRFSAILTEFEAVHQWVTPWDLRDLLIFLGVWASGAADAGPAEDVGAPVAVKIMTVHSAKGLEWPVVFLPQLVSGVFPSRMRTRGVRSFVSSTVFDGNRYASGDYGERRLWYVGLTRCCKFLNVSAVRKPRFKPTALFDEIVHPYVRGDGQDPTERQRGKPQAAHDVELFPTTFSDLNYYWSCPADYQLRRIMGFGPGVREAYGYGQQVHNILAEIHDKARAGEALSEDMVANLVFQRFNLRYTRGRPLDALRAAATRSLVRYISEYQDQARLVLEAEKPFEFVDRESGALISGTIDLLERLERDASGQETRVPVGVVDFKTHKWDDEEGYDRRVGEVTLQLRLYAAAARGALGLDPARAEAHFLAPSEPPADLQERGLKERFEVDVREERQEETLQIVSDTVRDIKAEQFQRDGVERGRCGSCDFQLICPGYAELDAGEPQSLETRVSAEVDQVLEEQGFDRDGEG